MYFHAIEGLGSILPKGPLVHSNPIVVCGESMIHNVFELEPARFAILSISKFKKVGVNVRWKKNNTLLSKHQKKPRTNEDWANQLEYIIYPHYQMEGNVAIFVMIHTLWTDHYPNNWETNSKTTENCIFVLL